MVIRFTVPGLPVPKGRPRFTTRGKFAVAYTPAKTKTYEQLVAWHGKVAMGAMEPLNGPLCVDLVFTLPIPASTSKKLALELLNGPHTKKPDLDNMAKAIFDSLNGICYLDDGQICQISARKVYGELVGANIEIWVQGHASRYS